MVEDYMEDKDGRIINLAARIADAVYINLLPPPVARQRKSDIYNILLKAHAELWQERDDLTRRLYIAEKALEDSKL